MIDTEIVKVEEKAIDKIKNVLKSDISKASFSEVLGASQANGYITSIILAVANSDKLQQCNPRSTYTSALRAATLRLSVDPSLGQAYVPMGTSATLLVGYKGLQDLAIRTGRYRYINAGRIYDGENVVEDRITGFHKIEGCAKEGGKLIGWIAAFEMTNGFGKSLYMPREEIHNHAKKYSKSYDKPDGIWKKDPEMMERKTILRLLLRKWGYLSPEVSDILQKIDEEKEFDATDVIDENLDSSDDTLDAEFKETGVSSSFESWQSLSREEAENTLSHDGIRYGDIEQKDLDGRIFGITKKMKMPDLPEKDRKELQRKLDAIAALRYFRSGYTTNGEKKSEEPIF